jgi:translation initiation factor 5A
MGEEDETFEVVESGSSLTYPISAGALKKGDYVVIKGHPCKIIDVSVSKTGKHGHAKASITALDIFTKQKLEEQSPTTHNLPAPFVKTANYTLLDIGKDGRLSLMDEESNTREDLNLPDDEELATQLKDLFAEGKELVLIVVSAMGKEQVLSFKGAVEK